jgi:aspartyl-tRNA(Asn)/glutamyl-tRNA(Gln) amidotransferase subunit B
MSIDWEPVIGLEVHCQLLTQEKLFCSCPTDFGAPINRNTCPICLGHPGVLPVLNAEAVEFAIRAGLALNCTVNLRSVFARKHYFYPDLPKGYQITQYELPILEHGRLALDLEGGASKTIGITRIHMEEDAGKSIHMDTGATLIDLNRAGVPLIEIVSEPEMRSAEEAVAYLKALHEVVRYLGICDGNMEEGSFRCDANVSIRPRGQAKFGTRAEIKNMNTFRGVQRAIEYEILRHAEVLEGGGVIVQETRLWDEAAGRTRSMRGKEDAHDYRYFPEPDLPVLRLESAQVEGLKASQPELPRAMRLRLVGEYGLSAYDAGVLTGEPVLARYFETAVATHRNPKAICNWVTSELLGRIGAAEVDRCAVRPEGLARLVALIDDATISGKIAKTVFERMLETGRGPDEVVEAEGLRQVTDTGAVEVIVRAVLEANPTQVSGYRAGKLGLKGFLVGQVMKQTGGKANPGLVNELLDRILAEG